MLAGVAVVVEMGATGYCTMIKWNTKVFMYVAHNFQY